MSSKKIGKMVGADVDRALANISASTPKPDMKADDTLKAAAAPSRDMTFAERFKYARMAAKAAGLDPSKQTFTHNGKTYNTRMAGEGTAPARRSGTGSAMQAKPAASTTNTPKSDVSGRTKEFFKGLPMKPKAEAPKVAPKTEEKPKRDNTAAGRRERMGRFLSSLNPYNQADAKGKTSKPILLTGEAARRASKGTIGGMAKGGKIDGCAVRGKTRAMKKGK